MNALARVLLIPALLGAAGCAVVGPASISNGRAVYNEVINYTEDQQILDMIVRERYGQTWGMLSVASVTANVKFRADAASEFRAWGQADDTDDLVPLSFGLAYEENPTISYIPVLGASTQRRLVLPITVEEGYLVSEAAADQEIASRELFRSINGVQNPIGGKLCDEWEQLCEIREGLRKAGVMMLGRARLGDDGLGYVLYFGRYEEHIDEVRTLFEMLGLDTEQVDGESLALPFYTTTGRQVAGAVTVETRSVMDWIRHAGSTIEVPAEHVEAGIVMPTAWGDPRTYRFMTIHTSKKRPKNAIVAVQFRDWWYYVDASDPRTKESFRLVKFLIRLRLDVESHEQKLPVLTVPVG